MTFFNDLWKKLTPPSAPKEWGDTAVTEKPAKPAEDHQSSKAQQPSAASKSPMTEAFNKKSDVSLKQTSTGTAPPPPEKAPAFSLRNTDEILKAFHDTEVEAAQEQKLISNLKALQEIVNQPKEEAPDLRFTQVKQHLGTPEAHETVRQERWPDKIRCPNCHSNHLKRLPVPQNQAPENHRYHCLACGTEFNDDTGTPIEQGIPPVNIWMLCWYLMGCTDSVVYIASKLNLDIKLVEIMMEQLQKTFNAQKPLTRFLGFDEWNAQSKGLRKQLQDDLIAQHERLNANIASIPKDTAEFRRQQNLRRTLDSSTNPSPAAPGSKRR